MAKKYKLKAHAKRAKGAIGKPKSTEFDSLLPQWLRGRGIVPSKVRIHLKDGTKLELDPTQPFEVEDERTIRHLDADPRFDKL